MMCLAATTSHAEDLRTAPIPSIVTGTADPLQVDLTTDGDRARMTEWLGRDLPLLAGNNIRSERTEGFGATLTRTVGELDRENTIEQSIGDVMRRRYPVFEFAFAASPEKYLNDDDPNFAALRRDGHCFVLLVDDRFS